MARKNFELNRVRKLYRRQKARQRRGWLAFHLVKTGCEKLRFRVDVGGDLLYDSRSAEEDDHRG